MGTWRVFAQRTVNYEFDVDDGAGTTAANASAALAAARATALIAGNIVSDSGASASVLAYQLQGPLYQVSTRGGTNDPAGTIVTIDVAPGHRLRPQDRAAIKTAIQTAFPSGSGFSFGNIIGKPGDVFAAVDVGAAIGAITTAFRNAIAAIVPNVAQAQG